MTERTDDGQTDAATEQHPETSAERRRRRASVFGEVLPDATSDERADGWSERDGGGESDDWLRRQVPPHHG